VPTALSALRGALGGGVQSRSNPNDAVSGPKCDAAEDDGVLCRRVVRPSMPMIVVSSISAMPTETTSCADLRTDFSDIPAADATTSMGTARPDRNSWKAARRTGNAATSNASRLSSKHPRQAWRLSGHPDTIAGVLIADVLGWR
jgi:hypothetical protein